VYLNIVADKVIALDDKTYRTLHRPRNFDAKLIWGWTITYLCVWDHTSRLTLNLAYRFRGTINGNYIFNFYIWILSSSASCLPPPWTFAFSQSKLRIRWITLFASFFFFDCYDAEIAEGMDRMVLLAHLITVLLHFYYVKYHLRLTVQNLFWRIYKAIQKFNSIRSY